MEQHVQPEVSVRPAFVLMVCAATLLVPVQPAKDVIVCPMPEPAPADMSTPKLIRTTSVLPHIMPVQEILLSARTATVQEQDIPVKPLETQVLPVQQPGPVKQVADVREDHV